MDDLIGADSVHNILMLLVLVSSGFVLWVIEAIYNNDKKALIWIALLPPTLLFYIIKQWEACRGRMFFIALLIFTVFLFDAVVGYSFASDLWVIFKRIFMWPYFVFTYFSRG